VKRLAEILSAQREDILAKWRHCVLEDPNVPQANRLAEPALRDSVPQLVASLIAALEQESAKDESNAGRALAEEFMPREHAQDRFQQGYTLTAALRELSHLRACILDALVGEEDLSRDGLRFMHAALDQCMTIAAQQMERSRTREVEQEARRLTEVGEVRERFLAILGHDLRNPLNTIKVAGSLLLVMDLPEAAGSFVKRIVRAADRMIRMINDLLDFAAVRSGVLKIERRYADLRDVCNEVADELRLVHPHREIVVDARGDLAGDWDVPRIAQVVSNLLSNAVTYSPHGTLVRLEARGHESDVTIDVHNEGKPIPDAVQARIFEPFQRGDASGGSAQGGVGLGLFIACEMVRAHGGTISLLSEEGRGTTFKLKIPRRVT
jgi:signal transduction histidine kinase